jgi:hypothetical protein
MIGHRVSWDEHGEPTVTLTVQGWSDVFRLTYNLIHAQVEFCAHGTSIFKALRRKNRDLLERVDLTLTGGKVVEYMGWRPRPDAAEDLRTAPS